MGSSRSPFSSRYGEALRLTTTSAPAATAVAIGPHGNQRSSQIVTATSTRPKLASSTPSPGTK